MSIVVFDPELFRTQFPAFADETRYPDATLQAYFNTATCYINPTDSRCLNGDCLVLALNSMTAHLCRLNELATSGKISGIVTSASIDGVSCLLYTSPSPRDRTRSRMPSSA